MKLRCRAINLTAMTDADGKNNHSLILNFCKDSVRSNTITPLIRQNSRQLFTFATGIRAIQDILLKISSNSLLNRFFKFFQVFKSFWGKFQLPSIWQILSQDQVPFLCARKEWFSYRTLSILYKLEKPIQSLLALPRIWLALFLHSKLLPDLFGRQEHQALRQYLWLIVWKTFLSHFFLTTSSNCSTFYQKVKVFAVLFFCSAYAESMSEGHNKGKFLAGSLVGNVQQAATSTSPSTVPGFVTDSPKEVSLDNGSISGATSAEVIRHEAAEVISENSRTRQKFVIDPNTDPLFINANRATANPEQTMQEMIVETSDGTEDQDEIVECMEGGKEYLQTCRKQLVIKIQITPEERWCECDQHWWYPGLGHHHHVNGNAGGGWAWERLIPKQVEILSEEWEDGCTHLEEQSDQGRCYYVERVHGEPETRTISGPIVNPKSDGPFIETEPITRDHWEETYTYVCLKKIEGTCEALRAKGCIDNSSVCVEEIGGVCVAWEKKLRCPSPKKKTRKYRVVGEKSPFCLTGDCAESDYEANGEMLNAMAHLAVLKEVQNDIRANIGIFKGQSRQCRKNCLGFRDCCTNGKGWGVSMHLSECSGEERELAAWRKKKRCVFVGTYCAEREPITRFCIRKKSSFCCFGTKLARLINSQGRAQLGLGWGDVEGPDCRGLTPDELSRLDMSRMNLSELYEDVQANFKPKAQEHIAQGVELDRIRENMSRMTKKVKISDAEITTADASSTNIPRDEL